MSVQWETVIGLEVHCQLETRSKLFSSCPVEIGAEPNTRVDAYSYGMPGTLPVPNAAAIDAAIALAIATGCAIAPRSAFARKHYFYPDLPKGYQITQADQPYATGGGIEVPGAHGDDGAPVRVRLQRIHLEEDAGKTTHVGRESRVDYNRAGAPLLEIVSEPDLRSSEHAAAYVRELRTIVRTLGISAANMEEGTLRCDANVSLRPRGSDVLGVRCEIKNVNSFRFLARAIEAEVRRQRDLIDRGEPIVRCTLGYDGERDRLRIMRTKEDAADYRYLPDPDLPLLEIEAERIARVRAAMPELPAERRRRWIDGGVGPDDAFLLGAERELAELAQATLAALAPAHWRRAASFIAVEVLGRLNADGLAVGECRIAPASLAELIELVGDGTLSSRLAKDVFARMWAGEGTAREIVDREGLRQVSDSSAIAAAIAEVLAENPRQLAALRAGKDALRGFFVGQVMKKTRGQANPQLVGELLDRAIAEVAS